MEYFIDSGVWIAYFNRRDSFHQVALSIIPFVLEQKNTIVYISDYVIDEVVTYIRKKIGPKESIEAAVALLDSNLITVLYNDSQNVMATYHIFSMFPRLSFTDANNIAWMRKEQIPIIFSFDSGFDGIPHITRLMKVPEFDFK